MISPVERNRSVPVSFGASTTFRDDNANANPAITRLLDVLASDIQQQSGASADNGTANEERRDNASRALAEAIRRNRGFETLRSANQDIEAANVNLRQATSVVRQALAEDGLQSLVDASSAAERISEAARSIRAAVARLAEAVGAAAALETIEARAVQRETQDLLASAPYASGASNDEGGRDDRQEAVGALSDAERAVQRTIEALADALRSNEKDFDIPPAGAAPQNPPYPDPEREEQRRTQDVRAAGPNDFLDVAREADSGLRLGTSLLTYLREIEGETPVQTDVLARTVETAERDVAVATFALTEAVQAIAGAAAATVGERTTPDSIADRRRRLDLST